MALLSDPELTTALAGLTGWEGDGSAIRRTVEAADFPTAIRIVDAVAEAAEAADHHPDIDIRWRTLHFTLSTHSEGGVTTKDVALAGTINEIAGRHAR
ncbi:4a-hydroxytetrahydrobiopterin dehydratase [Fodinicola acaciae]|uniref:4a-hydroxytetrahydrobiopterin dehydratase n=1 Tax=Fodinicola acaciae TaxID=2681555 RepID=UPI0013D484A0|nr:4a-hydroxytetrahydrobiopterin dehydratase [Fodinicola acaciae]